MSGVRSRSRVLVQGAVGRRGYHRGMSATIARSTGVVETWNDERGFGFIRVAGSPRTLFVHISAFPQGPQRPRIGDEVTFVVEPTADGRSRAAFVHFVSPVAPRIRRSRSTVATDVIAAVGILAFLALYLLVQVVWGALPLWVTLLYVGASALSFVAYAVDKSAAVSGGYRIAERSLIALGIVGGWPGGLVAQRVFRHKTRKQSFRISFWGGVLLNVIAFVLLSSPAFRVALENVLEIGAR